MSGVRVPSSPFSEGARNGAFSFPFESRSDDAVRDGWIESTDVRRCDDADRGRVLLATTILRHGFAPVANFRDAGAAAHVAYVFGGCRRPTIAPFGPLTLATSRP